jgi:hypothetical protein
MERAIERLFFVTSGAFCSSFFAVGFFIYCVNFENALTLQRWPNGTFFSTTLAA